MAIRASARSSSPRPPRRAAPNSVTTVSISPRLIEAVGAASRGVIREIFPPPAPEGRAIIARPPGERDAARMKSGAPPTPLTIRSPRHSRFTWPNRSTSSADPMEMKRGISESGFGPWVVRASAKATTSFSLRNR